MPCTTWLQLLFLILQLGGTCLILASYNGHLDIVALVLGCGADVNMQDKVCVKVKYIYLITRVSMQYRELLHEWAWYFHEP